MLYASTIAPAMVRTEPTVSQTPTHLDGVMLVSLLLCRDMLDYGVRYFDIWVRGTIVRVEKFP